MPVEASRVGSAPTSSTRRVVGTVPNPTSAWSLDSVAFHAEFDLLLGDLHNVRARATELWHSADPTIASFLAGLPTHTPEDWAIELDQSFVGEWYRVCMSAHVVAAPGYRWPVRLRNRLPDLGWTPSDSRRLARGRPLAGLAQQYAAADTGAVVALVLPADARGWLSAADVDEFAQRFRSMAPDAFRWHQHLIPLVEDAFEVLNSGATLGDRVLVLPSE